MSNFHRNARKETAMFPKNFSKVAESLKGALGLHKSRADCFAAFIITAVEAKSILLGEVAKRLPGTARGKSKFHRLQDFFREVRLDFNAVSRMIMGVILQCVLYISQTLKMRSMALQAVDKKLGGFDGKNMATNDMKNCKSGENGQDSAKPETPRKVRITCPKCGHKHVISK